MNKTKKILKNISLAFILLIVIGTISSTVNAVGMQYQAILDEGIEDQTGPVIMYRTAVGASKDTRITYNALYNNGEDTVLANPIWHPGPLDKSTLSNGKDDKYADGTIIPKNYHSVFSILTSQQVCTYGSQDTEVDETDPYVKYESGTYLAKTGSDGVINYMNFQDLSTDWYNLGINEYGEMYKTSLGNNNAVGITSYSGISVNDGWKDSIILGNTPEKPFDKLKRNDDGNYEIEDNSDGIKVIKRNVYRCTVYENDTYISDTYIDAIATSALMEKELDRAYISNVTMTKGPFSIHEGGSDNSDDGLIRKTIQNLVTAKEFLVGGNWGQGTLGNYEKIANAGLNFYDNIIVLPKSTANEQRITLTHYNLGMGQSIDKSIMDSAPAIFRGPEIYLCYNKDTLSIEKPPFTVVANDSNDDYKEDYSFSGHSNLSAIPLNTDSIRRDSDNSILNSATYKVIGYNIAYSNISMEDAEQTLKSYREMKKYQSDKDAEISETGGKFVAVCFYYSTYDRTAYAKHVIKNSSGVAIGFVAGNATAKIVRRGTTRDITNVSPYSAGGTNNWSEEYLLMNGDSITLKNKSGLNYTGYEAVVNGRIVSTGKKENVSYIDSSTDDVYVTFYYEEETVQASKMVYAMHEVLKNDGSLEYLRGNLYSSNINGGIRIANTSSDINGGTNQWSEKYVIDGVSRMSLTTSPGQGNYIYVGYAAVVDGSFFEDNDEIFRVNTTANQTYVVFKYKENIVEPLSCVGEGCANIDENMYNPRTIGEDVKNAPGTLGVESSSGVSATCGDVYSIPTDAKDSTRDVYVGIKDINRYYISNIYVSKEKVEQKLLTFNYNISYGTSSITKEFKVPYELSYYVIDSINMLALNKVAVYNSGKGYDTTGEPVFNNNVYEIFPKNNPVPNIKYYDIWGEQQSRNTNYLNYLKVYYYYGDVISKIYSWYDNLVPEYDTYRQNNNDIHQIMGYNSDVMYYISPTINVTYPSGSDITQATQIDINIDLTGDSTNILSVYTSMNIDAFNLMPILEEEYKVAYEKWDLALNGLYNDMRTKALELAISNICGDNKNCNDTLMGVVFLTKGNEAPNVDNISELLSLQEYITNYNYARVINQNNWNDFIDVYSVFAPYSQYYDEYMVLKSIYYTLAGIPVASGNDGRLYSITHGNKSITLNDNSYINLFDLQLDFIYTSMKATLEDSDLFMLNQRELYLSKENLNGTISPNLQLDENVTVTTSDIYSAEYSPIKLVAERPKLINKELYTSGFAAVEDLKYYSNNDIDIPITALNGKRVLAARAYYDEYYPYGSMVDNMYYDADTTTYKDVQLTTTTNEYTATSNITNYYGASTKNSEVFNVYSPLKLNVVVKPKNNVVNQTNANTTVTESNSPITFTFNDENNKVYSSQSYTSRYRKEYYIRFSFDIGKYDYTTASNAIANIVKTTKANTWIGPLYKDLTIYPMYSTNINANTLSDDGNNAWHAISIAINHNQSWTDELLTFIRNKKDIYNQPIVENTLSSVEGNLKNNITNNCGTEGGDKKISYYAEDAGNITLINRLYDFRVTDVSDINFKNVFRVEDGSNAHTGKAYYSGDKKWDVDNQIEYNKYTLRTVAQLGTTVKRILPIGPYKNDNGVYIAAPKLGYRFSFDFKLTGKYNDKTTATIIPHFYYISKDGEKFISDGTSISGNVIGGNKIKLFYKNNDGKYVEIGTANDKYEISFVPSNGYRLLEYSDETKLSNKAIEVNLKSVVLNSDKTATISNNANVTTFYGEYKLPNSTIVVEVDKNGKYDINKTLKDGYIGVVFEITAKSGGNTYNYNKKNTCDVTGDNSNDKHTSQWDLEGYMGITSSKANGYEPSIRLEKGTWKLTDTQYTWTTGTVILYDIDNRAASDFE